MIHEFDIIDRFFAKDDTHRSDVTLGIGDDAALVKVPKDHELVVTTDTLTAGIHFLPTATPSDLGHQALAINLSDLAAMGARPAFATLALTLDKADETWLRDFSAGFFALAKRYQLQLIGGNISKGPLSITVQALGFIKPEQALLRSNAKANDLIYVTGNLGDAGLALAASRLHRAEPRIEIGLQLAGMAHAAIDVSDGLAADLGHILAASKVGANINVDQLPLSTNLKNSLAPDKAITLALTAGEDYELCFTIAPEQVNELEKRLAAIACPCTCIGHITAQPGLILQHQDGSTYHGPIHGYQHF